MRMLPSDSLNQVAALKMIGEKSGFEQGEEYAERGEEHPCNLLSIMTAGKENHIDTDRTAQEGDIITLELSLVPENGFVPEPLFDTMGRVSFVVGWGNYLPGLHQLILERGCRIGSVVENVSLDAGWGRRRSDLLFTVSKETLERQNVQNVHDIQPGSWLKIPNPSENGHGSSSNTVHVLVDQVTDVAVVLDANAPLAGSSYSCSFRVLSIDSLPSSLDMAVQQQQNVEEDDNDDAYQETTMTTESICSHDHHLHVKNTDFQVATFALGCFWGAELAFARQVGVVGTRVGYSQGITKFPTYQQVCSGTTKHRESVIVIYNAAQVSYLQLLQLAIQRLDQTMGTSSSNSTFITFHEDENDGNDDLNNDPELYPSQYKPGFYYHSEDQYETARTFLEQRYRRRQHKATTTAIELLPAATFYNAEDYHQQYLYKGGQSARKGATETIRCYG